MAIRPTAKFDIPARYLGAFSAQEHKQLEWLAAYGRSNSNSDSLRTVVALTDAAATLTATQMIDSGIFTITPGADRILTTPTAAQLQAGYPVKVNGLVPIGSSFEFSVICLAAFNATITAGSNVTVVGSGAVNNASGTFKAVFDSATTVKIYRI